MPLIDLPLAELRTYPGRNPRPEGFDAYWRAGLAELDALDPRAELTPLADPAPFARAWELRWTGVGGARVFAKLLRPTAGRLGPALLRFHGYTMSSGDWFELLPFAAAGFTVAAMDVRGQGGRSTDPGGHVGTTLHGHIVRGLEGPPEGLFYRGVFLDAAQLARLVMALDGVDPDRVGATGWSQGGGLTLACGALEPRVARLAPVYPFLSDYRRVWEMDQAQNNAYDELRSWFRRFDPTHERETETFERLGHIDVQHLAPRVRGKTLMQTGLMDVACPASTQFAAYNKLGGPKEAVIYPDFGHEGLPGASDRIFEFMLELA